MIFRKRYFLLLITVFFIGGCSHAKHDFEIARKDDTIESYKYFQSNYPSSKYDTWINDRLNYFDQIQQKNQQIQLSSLGESIEKIKLYKLGVTEEDDFLNDGWNVKTTYFKKVGIVGFEKKKNVNRYDLGTQQFNSKFGISELLDYHAKISQLEFEDNYKRKGDSSWHSKDSAKVLCTLTFTDKILTFSNC